MRYFRTVIVWDFAARQANFLRDMGEWVAAPPALTAFVWARSLRREAGGMHAGHV
jgi:hypothetical protein